MVNLILVCGQGSIGKSTLVDKIAKKDDLVIKLDDIKNKDKKEFIRQVQDGINKEINNIFCDMAFDCAYIRQEFLFQLYWNKINLFIIQLRPPLNELLKWHEERIYKNFTKETENKLKTVYYNFEFVRDNEFEQFKNINKIYVYLYDNYNQKILFKKEIKL